MGSYTPPATPQELQYTIGPPERDFGRNLVAGEVVRFEKSLICEHSKWCEWFVNVERVRVQPVVRLHKINLHKINLPKINLHKIM